MPYLKTYNFFISHAWAYGESYHRDPPFRKHPYSVCCRIGC